MSTSSLHFSAITVAAVSLAASLALVFSLESSAAPSSPIRRNAIERVPSGGVILAACNHAAFKTCLKTCMDPFTNPHFHTMIQRECMTMCTTRNGCCTPGEPRFDRCAPLDDRDLKD